MIELRFDFAHALAIARTLGDYAGQAEGELRRIRNAGAYSILRGAVQRAPIASRPGHQGGTLRRSGFVRELGDITWVGFSVGYAKFQEFGWGQLGEASGRPWGDYQYLSPKRGMTARPYLRPSFEDVVPQIQQAVLAWIARIQHALDGS